MHQVLGAGHLLADPDGKVAAIYRDIARRTAAKLARTSARASRRS